MGREIRMVPADWQHPKDKDGNYIPLDDGFNKRLAAWEEENAKWQQGLRRDYSADDKWVPIEAKYAGTPFEDWDGPRPDPKDYMPDWPAEQRTHICIYEDCTEGTPISPVFATPEECARWLADNGASAFGLLPKTQHLIGEMLRAGFHGRGLLAECGQRIFADYVVIDKQGWMAATAREDGVGIHGDPRPTRGSDREKTLLSAMFDQVLGPPSQNAQAEPRGENT